MAEMASMKMGGQHWIIMDVIAASPDGQAKQAQIQAAFGERGMAEPLEELYEAGVIANPYEMKSNGQPPKRRPHVFEFSPAGQQMYTKRRHSRAVDADIAKARQQWEADATPPTPDEVEDEEKPKRGRPPGAKNKPKTPETESVG